MLPTPVFSTVRNWLLKLGLFNLEKKCEEGKWIWIIDSSIQMGAMKCLFIIGVRLEKLLKKTNFVLSHEDVEPLVLKTIESCPGEVVKEALNEAKKKTHGAISIVSDEGSELKRGVRLFQEEQPLCQKPIHLHDITHKVDLVLKRKFKKDCKWKKFTREMTKTIQQLKLSTSSHLAPPKQRQKSRMRSEIDSIEWGIKICKYLASDMANEFEKSKLSWVLSYRKQLNTYMEISVFFDITTKEVREHGYSQETIKILKRKGAGVPSSKRSREFFLEILNVVEEEAKKVPEGSRLLGCTEVLESVFGSFKQMEKNHASSGLTSLVLSLPAILGSLTEEVIKDAMEKISVEDLQEWISKNLGTTFCSLQRDSLGKQKREINKDYLDSHELKEGVVG